ncbi:MAG TPA: tetratricopeptide repeat protein [Candidatus Limnocylindria bacterium]|nr:tetratricopeptide repeat protein [Candidatus Limnocylindria bacterium]
MTAEVGLDKINMPMGANFGDVDNDGFLDIFLATGGPEYGALAPKMLLRNDKGNTFVDITASSGTAELHKGHCVAFADLGNTGTKTSWFLSEALLRGTREYNNLGDILFCLGDLPGARKNFGAALATYGEIGDQNGVALAQIGLGDVFLTMGKHSEAKEMYESSLEICRQLGSRGRQAAALEGAGNAQRMEGDVERAQKRYREAISILEEVGDKSEQAHIRLHLAELLLDEGKGGEAEIVARQSASVFGETRAGRYLVEANLLLSNALAAQGRNAEARISIEQVTKAAIDSHNRRLELKAAVTAARIQAASDSASDVVKSVKRLHKIISDAGEASFADVVLDARLAAGEIEMNSGNQGEGSAHLETLENDAKSGGFRLIARKAVAALRSRQGHAAMRVQN